MNKRFSTLMAAGLLMVGALFSNVEAQTTAKDLDLTAATIAASDLSPYYYIGLADASYYLTLDEITNTDATGSSTVKGKKFNSLKGVIAADVVAEGDKALFKIEMVKVGVVNYFKLINKSNGKSVVFKATATPNASNTDVIAAADDATAVASYYDLLSTVNFDASGKKLIPFHGGTTANTDELKLATTNFTIEATGSGVALALYVVDDAPKADLNDMYGNGFSLKFNDMTPAIKANPFTSASRIQAVTTTTSAVGTYLAVDGSFTSAEATGLALNTKANIDKFKAATFIVMDTIPLTTDGSSSFNGKVGAGYQFITVKGADLITAAADGASVTSTYNKRHAANANFSILNNANNPDSLIVEVVKPVLGGQTVVMASQTAYANNVRVSVVNFNSQNIVTTYSPKASPVVVPTRWSLITLGSDNIVAQKDLLGIYNIKSLNYATKGKVFGPETDDNTEAIDAKLVQLTKPEGQFMVTSTGAGAFTFKNRESLNTYSVTGLRKLADGNYTQANGDTLMIVAAVSTDGYKNYSQRLQLDKTAYNIAVYSAVTENVYLTEKHSAGHFVGLNTDVKEAANWRLVKFEEGKVTGDNAHAQDSIFLVTDLAYLKADGKYATDKKDTVTIFSYAIYNEATKEFLSYDANKKAFFCDPETKDLDVRDANIARFIIKEKGDNKYNLVVLGDGNTPAAYDAAITSIDGLDKLYGAFSDNKVNQNETGLYELTDNDLFVIEEVAAPLYRPVATFDTVTIYKEGNEKIALYERNNFLGMQHMADVSKMASAMFVDTAFVRGNTNKPQYLLAVEPSFRYHNANCDIPGHPAIPSSDVDTVYGRFLVNMVDSAYAYGFDKHDNPYVWENNQSYKLAFVKGFHTNDTLFIQRANNVVGDSIWVGKDNNEAIGKYAFRYIDRDAKSFIIETQTRNADGELTLGFVKWLNGTPAVITGRDQAEVFNMNEDEKGNPTDNEAIGTTEVSVIAGEGQVVINNAAAKTVTISNILGQTIAQTVITSDNATISVPAGIVVVAVEGEAAVKAIVK